MSWIVVAIGVFAWVIYDNLTSGTVNLTTERQVIYLAAMSGMTDPVKLTKLAKAFDKEGLSEQAAALRKRANLPNVSPAVQAQRQEALKQALSSTDPTAVRIVADALEKEGVGATAALLRQYADGLVAATTIAPIATAVPVAGESEEEENISGDIPENGDISRDSEVSS